MLPPVLSLAIIAVAGVVLWHNLGAIDAGDVAARFAAIPPGRIALAALLTVSACLAVAVYEVAMLRYLRSGLPDWRPALTALMAFPIGHAVGFGALSGGAVRYRVYSAAGLSAFSIGKVVLLSVFPFAMGLGLLGGVALVSHAADGARLLALDARTVTGIGTGLIALHVAYVTAVLRVRGPVSLRWFEFELPGPAMTTLQYALGLVEVLCAIGVLWVLLPDSAGIGFLPFAAVYILAITVGLLSSVPAGLGVVESVLLLMLREVDPEALLGAVLAYRLVYELIPFATAIALLVGWEGWLRRDPPERSRV